MIFSHTYMIIRYHNLIGLRHDYISFLGNEKLINVNVHLIVIVSQLTSERGWIVLTSTSEIVNLKFIEEKVHVMVNLEFTRIKVHELIWTIVTSQRWACIEELKYSSRIVYVVCSHDKLVGPTNIGIGSFQIWKL